MLSYCTGGGSGVEKYSGASCPRQGTAPSSLESQLIYGLQHWFCGTIPEARARYVTSLTFYSLSSYRRGIGSVSCFTLNYEPVISKSSFISSVTITSSFWSGKVLNINKESRKIEHCLIKACCHFTYEFLTQKISLFILFWIIHFLLNTSEFLFL